MSSNSTTKVSSDHVDRIVKSILNKKQRKVIEQQQTFLRRNTDEDQKRNNYLVDKFLKKKNNNETNDDDHDDFVSRPTTTTNSMEKTMCPICNENLSKLIFLSDREEHVERCLTKPKKNVTKSIWKCDICGTSFSVKNFYLAHLKKCSKENSVQLKHTVNFASKMIKNRIIKMEIPQTADEEQQQLAVALSASLKPESELPNAFEILQTAAKKRQVVDLAKTALWNVSQEDKHRISSTRLSSLCERVICCPTSEHSFRFSPSILQIESEKEFGHVDWWKITTMAPEDEEIPMTQLARILNENDE